MINEIGSYALQDGGTGHVVDAPKAVACSASMTTAIGNWSILWSRNWRNSARSFTLTGD